MLNMTLYKENLMNLITLVAWGCMNYILILNEIWHLPWPHSSEVRKLTLIYTVKLQCKILLICKLLFVRISSDSEDIRGSIEIYKIHR